MIEGNLRDVSLPGLLQFLASEATKSYRIKVTTEGQTGELFICKGAVVAASYGLLEGEDALCEFLSWRDGVFWVELLNPQFEVKQNLLRCFHPAPAFVDYSTHLAENNVGLNAILIASRLFGSKEWQDTIKQMPLEREDFVVLGWLGEGRTMRQALREFGFDISKATGVLSRLLKTESVEVLRPKKRENSTEIDIRAPGLNEPRIDPAHQRFVTTGGQEAAAASVAQEAARAAYAMESANEMAQEAFISTSFRPDVEQNIAPPVGKAPPQPKSGLDLAQVRASMEERLRSRSGRTSRAMPTASNDSLPKIPADFQPGETPLTAPPNSVPVPTAYAEEMKVVEPQPEIEKESPFMEPDHLGEPPAMTDIKPTPGRISLGAFLSAQNVDADSPTSVHRTGAMPMVSIDIDRLLHATFNLTQFGKLALTNPNLDAMRRQTLLDVQAGKSVHDALEEGSRPPTAVLSSNRYCLDRGYVETIDPVVPLTADLLLGRMDIDQYLLQRRRINGDQLRDLIAMAREEGIKLPVLLVRSGFLTQGDLETLEKEQKRFAFK
jgi:hypothetical protein